MAKAPWRLVPGVTRGRGRDYWTIGRDDGAGGTEFVRVEYSGVPRRWKIEQLARNHLATMLREDRSTAQQEAIAACNWPFPISFHEWSPA